MSSHEPYYEAIAFISDIHGNLEAVLADIEKQNISAIYCLGDIVGYGPDPLACLNKVKSLYDSQKLVSIVGGNHDFGVHNKNLEGFSSSAKESNNWTIKNLEGTEEEAFLAQICQMDMIQEFGRFQLVHSTLDPAPENWEYLKIKNASQNFVERKVVFVGHSHIPAIYSKYSSGKGWNPLDLFSNQGHYLMLPTHSEMLAPEKGSKQYRLGIKDPFPTMLINVGSIGQPRDENPNARYVLHLTIDYNTYIEFRQVGYDVEKTVAKHKERGLPCDERLATRLWTGGSNQFTSSRTRPDWFPF